MNVPAFKIFRVRRDGTLGPLFIGRDIVIKPGVWIKAKAIRTEGFKFRPGWHACPTQNAPHLTLKGRVWAKVELRGVKLHHKPANQGGLWYTAKQLRLVEVLNG